MQQTTNFNLPTYQGTDAPNLITGYNAAMSTIDSTMKANQTAAANADAKATTAASTANTANSKADTNAQAISGLDTRVDALEAGSFAPSQSDPDFTVTNLSGAKVTANGIVYIPQS